MIVPTAASMKFKFPAFRDLDDGDIEFAIEEATLYDYAWAIRHTQTVFKPANT
jgi:hypothetical protein